MGAAVCLDSDASGLLSLVVMPFDFAVVLMFFICGALFVLVNMFVGRLLRPRNPSADKQAIYECGERVTGDAWFQFNPRFYRLALAFLLFDVEVAFLFPVATVYRRFVAEGHGLLALAEVVFFVGVLFLGLVWMWRKGDLNWVMAPGETAQGMMSHNDL